ncbi:transcriptional regulator [Pseudoalteromonas sp. CnMc7-15]|uniref:Mor transcription activator family protein n=1 Tax=unclassified Pseudoalteromonas TaxID=194690 RepID=UPI001EF6FC31|nr:Mor transcription activator family protein [Pseudoalteromonas sp. CnMc7-15]MCG7565878.1 transcriptional regulator [Pseudoalteromonas sp. CnMc7-15]
MSQSKTNLSEEKQSDLFGSEVDQLQACLANLEGQELNDVRKRWPSTLQSLVILLKRELKKKNIADADKVAEGLTFALSHYFGGRDIYLPTDQRLKAALRDIQIWSEFKGNNVECLAVKFSLTERRVLEIIQEQRKAENARRQRSLF